MFLFIFFDSSLFFKMFFFGKKRKIVRWYSVGRCHRDATKRFCLSKNRIEHIRGSSFLDVDSLRRVTWHSTITSYGRHGNTLLSSLDGSTYCIGSQWNLSVEWNKSRTRTRITTLTNSGQARLEDKIGRTRRRATAGRQCQDDGRFPSGSAILRFLWIIVLYNA